LNQKIAVQTSAWYNSGALDPEIFGVYAVPTPGTSLRKLEDAVDAVIASFLAKGVDEAHLKRLKIQLAAGQIYARDNQNAVARRYGRALAVGLTIEDVKAWPDVLQSVTAQDIMAAARSVLVITNSVTGWQTPPKTEASK